MPSQFREQSPSNKQASLGPLSPPRQAEAETAYTQAIDAIKSAYKALLDAGVSKEQARGILPVCHYTSFTWTCSLQALLHFISLRASHDAQGEIRAYADGLANIAHSIVPEAFEAFYNNDSSF